MTPWVRRALAGTLPTHPRGEVESRRLGHALSAHAGHETGVVIINGAIVWECTDCCPYTPADDELPTDGRYYSDGTEV